MVFLTKSDYLRQSKKNNIISPRRATHGGIATGTKVQFPTQHRTLNHKCSQCIRKDAKKYSIGGKDMRWLCPVCIIKNNNKDVIEKPNFISAKQLYNSQIWK